MFASRDGHYEREVWLRVGRWLVAGLAFQLAADVRETAITTSWRASRRSPRSAPSSIISWSMTRARSEPDRDRRKAMSTDGEASDGDLSARGSGA
jgi:hypothetical protein